MNELLDLYITFVKIGCVNFGGGYAMLPLLERELVDKRHWTTMDDLRDYFSIGQCTPGIIAVNTATFIGYKHRGLAGALCATFGVVAPSLVIITVIAAFLQNFADYPVVQDAFAGIRVCVCVLILRAVEKLWKKAVVDRPALVICALVFLASAFLDLSPVPLILLAGVAGVVVKSLSAKGGDRA